MLDAGVRQTIGAIIKAARLKWKSEPTAEILGQQFRMSWDTNKNLSNEMKSKEGFISSKDVEIRGLRAKVTTPHRRSEWTQIPPDIHR